MKIERIETIDKNFSQGAVIENDTSFMDASNKLFEIRGLPWYSKEKVYCRLPQGMLDKLPEGLRGLAYHTPCVRARFMTDSPYVTLKAELLSGYDMSHMPRTGISGFDFYIGSKKNKKYIKTIFPDHGITSYKDTAIANCSGLKEWTINFPLYNGLKSLKIGIKEGSALEKAPAYSADKPIVFYGSSITQGGCASRPGNAYENIISRWLDADVVNMGFSGCAKGEPEMAVIISQIDMSVLVMDYDHNAPTAEHLQNTHEPFFKIIRKAKPDLPVIFINKPNFDASIDDDVRRKEIIYTTYKNALDLGDLNVYFIDGIKLFGERDRDSCTVDGCHPNDLGFMRMAENICPAIKKALNLGSVKEKC